MDMPAAVSRRCARICALVALLSSALVLIGWLFGIASLKGVLAGWPKMSPATALTAFLAAVSLGFSEIASQTEAAPSRSRAMLTLVPALAVVVIGLLGLANAVAGADIGLGPGFALLGFHEHLGAGEMPADMSFATALGLSLIGASLLLVRGRFQLFQALALAASLIGIHGFTHYLFGGEALAAYSQMSILTATSIVLLSAGSLCLRSDKGLLALLRSQNSAGWLARRLIFAAIVLPYLVGWIRLKGQMAGWFGTEGGAGLFATSTIVLVSSLVWGTTILLDRAERLRKRSEMVARQLADIVESSRDSIVSQDLQGTVISWNKGAEQLYGYTAEEMIGTSLLRLVPADRREEASSVFAKVGQGINVEQHDSPRLRKNGQLFDVSVTLSPLRNSEGEITGVSKVARDISVQKAYEREILRMSRLYSALSQVNQAIIGIHDRDELFASVCRTLVKTGGFSTAWIGLCDPGSGQIKVAEKCGDERGYIEALVGQRDDSLAMPEPFSSVIGEGRMDVCNDLRATNMQPLRAVAEIAGYGSTATLPLRQGEAVVGFISVHAAEAGVFQQKEMALLVEAAADISFALDKYVQDSSHAETAEAVRLGEESLRRSESRYRTLFDYAPDGIVIADPESYYIDANQSICRMLGYSRQELIGLHATDIVEQNEVWRVDPALSVIHSGASYQQEWRFRRKDGSTFDADVHVKKMPDGNLLGIIRDITEHKLAELKVERANRLYSVLSGINELIVREDDRVRLLREACRIAVERGNFPLAWVGEVSDSRLVVPLVAWVGEVSDYRKTIEDQLGRQLVAGSAMEDAVTAARVIVINDIASDSRITIREEALKGGFGSLVVLPLSVDGKVVAMFTIYAEQTGFFDEEELALLLELANDISFALDHIRKSERLEYLAYYDALTGLANRSLLLERLEQNMRSAASGGFNLALLMFDLERFKNINDSLGQAAGDELLRQVARWLASNAGDASLLAHLDADRFAVVMPEVRNESDVARFLARLIAAFQDHAFRLNDGEFRIAAKFGVAMFPSDGTKASTVYQNAESAVKNAKHSGDRYLFYAREMSEKVAVELKLENRLRRALENNEFELYYQPKVSRASGELVGAEALLRWNDPLNGQVLPGRIIPILEETGLIHDVGRWALSQAIADRQRWKAAGLKAIRIAVNVSPLQLHHRAFVDQLAQTIGAHADAAEGLELELTESMVMQDLEHSIASLNAIRAMGVRVAVDDFGTGFSSLACLTRLPLDTLKIDQSFVSAMVDRSDGEALVSTIITLAESLKLDVVAEGVETEVQARMLCALGCDVMQGFLFGRPMSFDVFKSNLPGSITHG
jgi:diguanylate cyclase (GGDEF)-like protein/PAS domain S-box-containing protein